MYGNLNPNQEYIKGKEIEYMHLTVYKHCWVSSGTLENKGHFAHTRLKGMAVQDLHPFCMHLRSLNQTLKPCSIDRWQKGVQSWVIPRVYEKNSEENWNNDHAYVTYCFVIREYMHTVVSYSPPPSYTLALTQYMHLRIQLPFTHSG